MLGIYNQLVPPLTNVNIKYNSFLFLLNTFNKMLRNCITYVRYALFCVR